ncbi:YtpR family tRNA-binding protein [[Acholeplasma] multilocale]|uniref:YtpR family tRNA-binding protein n=1 Tax=[Acholeplasma] multilocale TaxID=264638 RepID=UPI00047A2251|nr:hypothetical protein [[Acholeplasma] multilocale]
MNTLKYGIFYNKQFDTLMVSFDHNLSVLETEENGNLTILKNKENIVGINIFKVSDEIEIKNGFCSENKEVVNFVENKIKDIYPVKQDAQFRIGKVITCEDIEGTHLHLCKVDIGEEIQIVCGAKNVAAGQNVVVATVGTWMPNGMRIVEGKLRGHDSNGMICSARELQIPEGIYNAEGIIELGDSYDNKIGASFWEVHNEKNN